MAFSLTLLKSLDSLFNVNITRKITTKALQ